MYCTNCGQLLEDSQLFCPKCGTKVLPIESYTDSEPVAETEQKNVVSESPASEVTNIEEKAPVENVESTNVKPVEVEQTAASQEIPQNKDKKSKKSKSNSTFKIIGCVLVLVFLIFKCSNSCEDSSSGSHSSDSGSSYSSSSSSSSENANSKFIGIWNNPTLGKMAIYSDGTVAFEGRDGGGIVYGTYKAKSFNIVVHFSSMGNLEFKYETYGSSDVLVSTNGKLKFQRIGY